MIGNGLQTAASDHPQAHGRYGILTLSLGSGRLEAKKESVAASRSVGHLAHGHAPEIRGAAVSGKEGNPEHRWGKAIASGKPTQRPLFVMF